MSTTNNRRPQPGRVTGETIALFVVIGFVLVTLVTVYAAAKFGHQLAGLEPIPADPWETLFGVLKGDVAWPMASTVIVTTSPSTRGGGSCRPLRPHSSARQPPLPTVPEPMTSPDSTRESREA